MRPAPLIDAARRSEAKSVHHEARSPRRLGLRSSLRTTRLRQGDGGGARSALPRAESATAVAPSLRARRRAVVAAPPPSPLRLRPRRRQVAAAWSVSEHAQPEPRCVTRTHRARGSDSNRAGAAVRDALRGQEPASCASHRWSTQHGGSKRSAPTTKGLHQGSCDSRFSLRIARSHQGDGGGTRSALPRAESVTAVAPDTPGCPPRDTRWLRDIMLSTTAARRGRWRR